MSVKLMGIVFDRYPVGGGEMILALKLADHAHDDGSHIFPGVSSLAQKTRQSERSVQYQLRRMEQSGWLIAVDHGKGGRGRTREYRINPDWINGAELAPIPGEEKGADSAPFSNQEKDADFAPIYDETKGADFAPIRADVKGANDDTKGAIHDVKGATDDRKGATAIAPESSVNVIEPSKNRQPARRASRIALHRELRELLLPDWLPCAAWLDWCEHRESKATGKTGVPWSRKAAEVSLKKLEKIHGRGLSPVSAIDESVFRGWTGLWEAKDDAATGSGAQPIPPEWWKTAEGIIERGKQLGIVRRDGEVFLRFKARVVKAAGPGEWMEDMLRETLRFGEQQYDVLYAYFNDIPREQVAEAA